MFRSILFAASAAPTAASLLDLGKREVSCTKTLPTSSCCAAVAGHTVIAYTDCEGCALTTALNSFCDIVRCSFPQVTSCSSTTTLTSCAPTTTPYISKVIRSGSPCTSTITKTVPACGDCGITHEQTATINIDCKGYALTILTTTEDGAGICVCPTYTALTGHGLYREPDTLLRI